MNAQKIAGLKELGFSDDDIAELLSQAEMTQKSADSLQIAYKDDTTGDGGDGLTLSPEDLTAIKAAVSEALQEQAQSGAPVATKAARPWSFADAVRGDLRSDMVPR